MMDPLKVWTNRINDLESLPLAKMIFSVKMKCKECHFTFYLFAKYSEEIAAIYHLLLLRDAICHY